MSEVIKLLDIVWKNCNAATDHSWERVNHAMRTALNLAIGSGFKFGLGDFNVISEPKKYNFGFWCSDSVEWIYAHAIHSSNMSAIHAFEAWKGREPFIADEVTFDHRQNCYQHGGGDRKKERLFVGAWFRWQGVQVKVTSFADDQSYLNACSYRKFKREGSEYEQEKIDKRFKLSPLDIQTGRAELKERRELMERLEFVAANGGKSKKIYKALDALGVKTRTEINALPLDKLREVADNHAPKSAMPVVTQEHIDAAIKVPMCDQRFIKKYKHGTPLTKISRDHWEWIERNLPQYAGLRKQLPILSK